MKMYKNRVVLKLIGSVVYAEFGVGSVFYDPTDFVNTHSIKADKDKYTCKNHVVSISSPLHIRLDKFKSISVMNGSINTGYVFLNIREHRNNKTNIFHHLSEFSAVPSKVSLESLDDFDFIDESSTFLVIPHDSINSWSVVDTRTFKTMGVLDKFQFFLEHGWDFTILCNSLKNSGYVIQYLKRTKTDQGVRFPSNPITHVSGYSAVMNPVLYCELIKMLPAKATKHLLPTIPRPSGPISQESLKAYVKSMISKGFMSPLDVVSVETSTFRFDIRTEI